MQCYLFGICLVSYSWPPGGCFIGCWARVFYPFTRLPISRSARNISGHPLHPVQVPSSPSPHFPLTLSLPPAEKVSGCFTQIVAALGELSFWCAAPSSLWGGWRWYHPQSVYCLLVFWLISCDSFRFVPFTVTLPLSPFLTFLPFSSGAFPHNSRSSIPHFSHFVAYCVAFCASLFVHFHSCPAPGRCIIKRCFFVACPAPRLKGRIGSGIVATVCQHLL